MSSSGIKLAYAAPPEAAAGVSAGAGGCGGSGGVIDRDVLCVGCGYNLRGSAGDAVCPECGRPVSASRLRTTLGSSDPHWVRGLQQGLVLVLAAAPCALTAVLIVALELYNAVPLAVSTALGAGAVVLATVGVWRLTQPPPRERLLDAALALPMLTRAFVTLGALVSLWVVARSHVLASVNADALLWGALAFSLAGLVLLLLHLRTLARRVPDDRLAGVTAWLAAAVALNALVILSAGLGIMHVLQALLPEALPDLAPLRLTRQLLTVAGYALLALAAMIVALLLAYVRLLRTVQRRAAASA